MKHLLTFLVLLFYTIISTGQDNSSLVSMKITIDWDNEINKEHKYKNIYSQKDEDYIKWVYKTSKNVTEYTSDQSKEKMYYHDGRGNDPIVFTIEEVYGIREEIYKNAVKPTKKLKSNFSVFIPKLKLPRIEGDLPKGLITYFSDSSKGYEMGIELDNNNRNVKIEILDLDKNLIQMIENKVLEKGWNHYKWDTDNVDPGEYILKYTVDGQVMTQVIEIDTKGSIFRKFFEWLF